MAFRAKNSQQARLRARFHDYNSQRRFRNQTTISWRKYKAKTGNGAKKLTKGNPK